MGIVEKFGHWFLLGILYPASDPGIIREEPRENHPINV